MARSRSTALVAALLASVVAGAPRVEFGLGDGDAAPAGGWRLVSTEDLTTYHDDFVEAYNANGGLDVVEVFQSGNCCVGVADGMKLWITGTKYGFQFPASTTQAVRCNPAGGYAEAKYQLYQLPKLSNDLVFSAKAACTTDHNPSIYVRIAESTASVGVFAENDGAVRFGITDAETHPGGRWQLMGVEDFQRHKQAFVDAYNNEGGIPTIKLFQSGNCCFGIKGGMKLTISETPYNFQFPSDGVTGVVRCNPEGGYTGKYRFFRSPTLSMTQTFGELAACSTRHNPAVYMQLPTGAIEFGLHDADETPEGGWELMSLRDFNTFKKEFVTEYNNNGGISTIKSFTTRNCCFALRDEATNAAGQKLIISDTPYGYQFPADTDHGIQCNPAGGYDGGKYLFYRVFKMAMTMEFTERDACATSHNPGIFIRGHPKATTTTTTTTPAPVHCTASSWSAWTACTKTCGGGTAARARSIVTHAQHGGYVCPAKLAETTECNTQPCPIHCATSSWSAWSACSATCGEGISHRSRSVTDHAEDGGTDCPALLEHKACRIEDCPVHCDVGAWGTWTVCDAQCGGGAERRERSIATPPTATGSSCPHLEESRACNTQMCPVHCQVTGWSGWMACNAECGGGFRERMRATIVDVQYDGNPCPHLRETEACNKHACPVHCVVSEWQAWGTCTTTCGSGLKHRTRTILVNNAFQGNACPTLDDSTACATQPCPIDCAVSSWGAASACDVTCGDGKTWKERTVVTPASLGGQGCPSLKQGTACSTNPCPVHCETSDWTDWGACTKTCGSGTTTRTRAVTQHATFGGTACPNLEESLACNASPCPVDCVTSEWSLWGACSTTCAAGTQTRERTVSSPAVHGGVVCPPLRETQACNDGPCPVHCSTSEWSEWSACTTTCGKGSQSRARTVVTHPDHGGYVCPNLTEPRECQVVECPVHCEMHEWGVWQACSTTCGDGQAKRDRLVKVQPQFGGNVCPVLSATQQCNEGPCPVHCDVSAFSDWSACSTTCGKGTELRHRSILTHADHGGFTCPALTESRQCEIVACPIHCEVSEFSVWSACSVSCSHGTQLRARKVTVAPQHGGTACPELLETERCNEGPCPVHCEVSQWAEWSSCSTTCGKGIELRLRVVVTHAANGGYVCPNLQDQRDCEVVPCPIHCAVSSFSDWSSCTASCGDGNRLRFRSVTTPPRWGGVDCPALVEHGNCNIKPCPIHCEVSAWTQWAECSHTCGGGSMTRARTVTTEANHAGNTCPALTQTTACNPEPCPVDCTVKEWGGWSMCTATCGGGSRLRVRAIDTPTALGGQECPNLSEMGQCNAHACPVHCVVTSFSEWTACTHTCGGGLQTRARTVTTAAQHGGNSCPALEAQQACNGNSCPVHCEVSDWTDWEQCSASCDGGTQSHSRTVSVAPHAGGTPCPPLSESQACGAAPCPVDCIVDDWGPFGVCSASCGEGTTTRTRAVLTEVQNGGAACAPLADSKSCNIGPCPIHCETSPWSAFSLCSEPCGVGMKMRFRRVAKHAEHGGYQCPALFERVECQVQPCAVDCQVSSFSEWSACDKTCGGGAAKRTRTVQVQQAHGGQNCPALTETRSCNTDAACPQDCVTSKWGMFGQCSVSCGTGTYERTRIVLANAAHGGMACPSLTHIDACDAGECPAHCELSPWTPFSDCSERCAGGTKLRFRTILKQPNALGTKCPELVERKPCNTAACGVDCVVGAWGAWGACSKTCGSGLKLRKRSITAVPNEAGKACPALEEPLTCGTKACPSHCMLSPWGVWGECSKVCGNGEQHRSRQVLSSAQYGGHACGATDEKQECNKFACEGNMEGLMAQISAPGLSGEGIAPRTYMVTYKTGWMPDSGSSSSVFIAFEGTKGLSRHYLLGDHFVNGKSMVPITVHEDIGLLFRIEVKTDGVDGWNAVNFIEVRTPTDSIVQFSADFVLDAKVTADPTEYGFYPRAARIWRRAVVPEVKMLRHKQPYEVSVGTGLSAKAGSIAAMFVQLHGTLGSSRFYFLGESFQAGVDTHTKIMVNEEVGLLNSVTVAAGGTDDWNPIGNMQITTPSVQKIEFPMGFWLDQMPHEAAPAVVDPMDALLAQIGQAAAAPAADAAVYFARKKVDALVPEKASEMGPIVGAPDPAGDLLSQIHGNEPSAATTTTAAPHVDVWDQIENMLKANIMTSGMENGQSAVRVTPAPTPAPTPVTYPHEDTCLVGSKSVISGWHGHGAGGNYCNLCQCRDGTLSCTKLQCGIPFGGVMPQYATGAKLCSHVKCDMRNGDGNLFPRDPATSTVHIAHHHLEMNGQSHACAYNKFDDKCTCYCWGGVKKTFVTKQAGVHLFSPTGYNALHCEDVQFAENFDPKLGDVRVLTTVSHTHKKWIAHDPAIMWVEYATLTHFRVCGSHNKMYNRIWEHGKHHFNVEFYAWQGDNKMRRGQAPWSGAQTGATAVAPSTGSWHANHNNCQMIKFEVPFSETPVVLGTLDHRGSPGLAETHDEITFWVENVNTHAFVACFRDLAHNPDGALPMSLNWLSFEHTNPNLWFENRKPYSAAGRVSSDKWVEYSYARSDDGGKVFLNCKDVEFKTTFTTTPTVLVTPNRYAPQQIDWLSTAEHRTDVTATYVDRISPSSFRVCSAESSLDGKPVTDTLLHWDYVAFASNAFYGERELPFDGAADMLASQISN
jgi:hypothetical protein